MSAQTLTELYVWPRRRQVEEGSDHAPILLLVHGFTILVRVQSRSGTHRCSQWLGVVHAKLLHHVPGVLRLMYRRPVLALLDMEA